MQARNLFNSFRVRLLFVLATLLIATLGVQHYLNRRAEQRVAQMNQRAEVRFNDAITEQEQALAAAFALAVQSLSSNKYLADLQQQSPNPLLRKEAGRVVNVLVVNGDGRVDDSLDPQYQPQTLPDGTAHYFNLNEVALPRLVTAERSLGEIMRFLPSSAITSQPRTGELRAFPFRINTNEGVNYIFVVLGSANPPSREPPAQAARPLWPTLVVMLAAVLATGFLLWRFTRPLQDLAEASRRVAAGDFDFRVPAADRRDEMGALAAAFNDMIARLGGMRELESRLNQAERSAVVGRLASAIAHEIRNPLNYINLTLDHLRTKLAPTDPERRVLVERLVDQLKIEVARINTRISEFLNYTRPATLELRPLPLRPLIDDGLRIVEAQAAESNIRMRVEQADELPPVVGDPESLRSVFTNLIINGVQAIDGGGGGGVLLIKLAPDDEGQRVRVDISDTGRGIPPENLPHLFEPYFSTKETGTGLGLAIVKKAVDDHHGTIHVVSRPGAGTTFTVTLPTTEGNDERRTMNDE